MNGTEQLGTTRWELTAPESLVLREGPQAKPAEVLKLAVLELVTRRVLRLVEVETKGWRGQRTTQMVIGAGSRAAPSDGVLALVAKIALEAKAKTYPDGTVGLGIPDFARAFVATYKNVPSGYVTYAVLPALEARGLYKSERQKWLRIFPYTAWTRTPEGDRARAELAELTTTAERDAGEWAEREPVRLASFLVMAGGAALLVPSAYPVFEDFAHRVRNQSDDGGFVPMYTASFSGSDDEPAGGGDAPDLASAAPSGPDFSALSVDFSGFAGIDSAFAGIDAGIDAGGAGGDGGGGDGGGGGGD